MRAVCFHAKTRCHACWDPTTGHRPQAKGVRLRCPSCGRFVRKGHRGECGVCVRRGFTALRLIEAA